ncbi:RNA polymerase sigma factor [Glycomyces tarimensis]
MDVDVEAAVAAAFRDQRSQVVATLIRLTGDWDLAEECTQDAFAKALEHWRREGVPRRPGAWLTMTARNRALDRLRRDAVGAAKLKEVVVMRRTDGPPEPDFADESGVEDDLLRLVFTCCHPALALEARVALTLRTLAGLTTGEIARAFLVPEPTMAQRLVRAKRKIRHAAIPFRIPPAHLLPERTTGVLGVIYLLFNEGYAASEGDELVRRNLCAEAVRLARVLAELMPDEPEAVGLLSLLRLHEARRSTRVDEAGDLITLEHQDRAEWDMAAIEQATGMLETALRRGIPGPYQVQATIAACHATAPDWDATDWPQIAALYGELARIAPSPVVALNRAVAVGMADGPQTGLALLAELEADGRLAGYHRLAATRAELLHRLGRRAEAEAAYLRALEQVTNEAERRHLERRLAACRS